MQKTILITGGTGKFGRTLIKYFLNNGNVVLFTSRRTDSIKDLQKEFANHKGSIIGYQTDHTLENSAKQLISDMAENGLYPDVLINNARSLDFLKVEPDGLVSRKNFVGELIVDVVAPYELTMALARSDHSNLKSVVNIGSMYGQVATNPALYDDHAMETAIHYGVAKAALGHLTKELAVRLAPSGVRVNCIAFGGVEGRVNDEFKKRYATLVPMRRMLRDDEIIGPVEYLITEKSSGMTGQVISVDGGWGIW